MYIEKEIKWNSSEQNGRPTSQELIMYRRSDRTRGERKTYSEQQVKATDGKIVNWLTGEIGKREPRDKDDRMHQQRREVDEMLSRLIECRQCRLR